MEILSCGVPQGLILRPLIFLVYVNDKIKAVDCYLLLYADESYFIFRDKNTEQIEGNLKGSYDLLCDCLAESMLNMISL